MAESDGKLRVLLITFFPMLIATLSLVTSIFNGYLNNKFVDLIQRNFGRAEYMRTCKETIDAYFQVKFKTGLIRPGSEADGQSPPQVDAANAVNHFAALGTYLANLRDDPRRERYTELSRTLEKIVADAPRTQAAQREKLFASADRLFAEMNDDCVKSAKATP